MIEQQFDGRYPSCRISPRGEYKLQNIRNPAIFCVDCVFDNDSNASGKHCDEFIFYNMPTNATGIYLVERKENTSNNIAEIKNQLQGGADFITAFVNNDSAFHGRRHNFKPVLVSKGMRVSCRMQLIQKKICLLGRNERIVHVPSKKALPPIT